MDAVILAGGIPQPEDPLYSYSKGDAKALIDVAGKPMIQWVLDALSRAKHVDNVIIVGLSPKNKLKSRKPVFYLSNQGRMLSNIVAGISKSLELNNKYQLDGRDPNSFTGVAWCFGKHDRAWAERPVFGKLRYMNDRGLERKFEISSYVHRISHLVRGGKGFPSLIRRG